MIGPILSLFDLKNSGGQVAPHAPFGSVDPVSYLTNQIYRKRVTPMAPSIMGKASINSSSQILKERHLAILNMVFIIKMGMVL